MYRDGVSDDDDDDVTHPVCDCLTLKEHGMNEPLEARLRNREVEAARYALIRRLVPVLRHHLVNHLQPIGLLYEVAVRKLGAVPFEQDSLRDTMTGINNHARAGVASTLDVVSWLEPEDLGATALGPGVEECLNMLYSNFTFRGFAVDNQVGDARLPVARVALREVFTAALIAATDSAVQPVRIELGAETVAGRPLLSIRVVSIPADGNQDVMCYRTLSWVDVAALARAHGVGIEHEGGAARLTFDEAAPAA